MGSSSGIWVPLLGLGALAALAGTGMVGGLILANNGHEVPAWLSSAIGATVSNFGIIVLVVFGAGRSSNNGNGGGSYRDRDKDERRLAGDTIPGPSGIKAG